MLSSFLLFSQFIRVLYYQLKHGFRKGENNKGSSLEKGSSLFLDDAWFSKDIFLFHLCKVPQLDFFLRVLLRIHINHSHILGSGIKNGITLGHQA